MISKIPEKECTEKNIRYTMPVSKHVKMSTALQVINIL